MDYLILFLLILFVLVVACGFLFLLKKQRIIGGYQQAPDFKELRQRLRDYLSKSHEKQIIYYSDIKNTIEYQSNKITKQVKINPHIGQRKLLLNELQFHSHYHRPNQLVIYTGSAPCEHLPAVLKYYPDVKFLLIDGNYHLIKEKYVYVYQNKDVISKKHLDYISGLTYTKKKLEVKKLENMEFLSGNIYDTLKPDYYDREIIGNDLFEKIHNSEKNIFIIQDYLTIEMCKFFSECVGNSPFSSILYLSDIRSAGTIDALCDKIFLFDNVLQAICIHYLQPDYAMLKYHPPFFDGSDVLKNARSDFMEYMDEYESIYNIDILDNYRKKIHKYFKYENIFLQPWAPPASSESRYIVSKNNIYNFVEIDYTEYEDKFTYLNIYRNYYFNDTFIKKAGSLPDYPYCGCFDCILEQHILLGPDVSNFNPKDIIKKYNEINEHLYYDIKNKTNKKSMAHGWNRVKYNKIFFLGKDSGRLYRIDEDEIHEIKSEQDVYLSDTFPPNMKSQMYNFVKCLI
jgi:hypothetical protein